LGLEVLGLEVLGLEVLGLEVLGLGVVKAANFRPPPPPQALNPKTQIKPTVASSALLLKCR
ncbi:MAG: hypothetical protein ACWIPH_01635, partial [Ostreibacterium sp.]